MKTAIISASILLAVATPAFSAAAAETPYIAESARALAAGLWGQSAALSIKALATPGLSTADTLQASTTLCISQIKLGDLNTALGTCDKAVKAGPKEWTAYINRGNLRAMLGYISAAKADYARAQALNPTHEVVREAAASRFTRSMVTAPFVDIGAPGAAMAKGSGAARSTAVQQ